MSLFRNSYAGALVLAASLACSDGTDSLAPRAQNSVQGVSSAAVVPTPMGTLLGRATFVDPKDPVFKVKRISDDWHVEIKSKPALDVAVQRIVFPAGSQSTWHRHPGPVFIQVVSGTIRFYESDDPTCTPIERTAGQGFLDLGDHPHIARNESGTQAENIVTYFAPPGVQLRFDVPSPGNCPF